MIGWRSDARVFSMKKGLCSRRVSESIELKCVLGWKDDSAAKKMCGKRAWSYRGKTGSVEYHQGTVSCTDR